MSDLTSATDADILAAVKARSDAKIAEALPYVEKLIEILDPTGNILQHSAIQGAARAIYQSCTTFDKVAKQLAALDAPSEATAEEVDPKAAPQG